VKSLFDFNREIDPAHLDKYLFLLAYAASVKDGRGTGSTSASSHSVQSVGFLPLCYVINPAWCGLSMDVPIVWSHSG
jgi:hypothetical protein